MLIAKPITLLTDLSNGEWAELCQIEPGHQLQKRLSILGFTPGVIISMVQNLGNGPVIVKLRGTRIALGRNEAKKIIIRNVHSLNL
jgi:ferrous iron transport protein A